MAVKKTVADVVNGLVADAAKPKRAPKAKKEAPIMEQVEDQVIAEDQVVAEETDTADDALFASADEPVPVKKARKGRTPKEPKEKPVKEPKPVSPYAGLSPHQKNRRIALEKYGTREGYTANDFRIILRPDVKETIQKILDVGTIRPSAKGKSHGGDRYLMQLARMGWPEGAAKIVYGDEYQAERDARQAERDAHAASAAEAKAAKEAEREALRTEKQAAMIAARAEKEAAKEAARAEKEAAKAAKKTETPVEEPVAV
jgi:hypothetical protein